MDWKTTEASSSTIHAPTTAYPVQCKVSYLPYFYRPGEVAPHIADTTRKAARIGDKVYMVFREGIGGWNKGDVDKELTSLGLAVDVKKTADEWNGHWVVQLASVK